MSIKLIIFFLLLHISAIARDEFVLSRSIVDAYSSCFNLDFEKAQSQLTEDKLLNKSNAFRYLIENYIDAIHLLVEDDPIFYKVALSRKVKRMEALSECNTESVFYYYVLSDIHLQWALIRVKFGEQVKAVNELRLAAKYNKLNVLKFPTFILNNKNNAVIQAIASSIPPRFSWIGKQFSIEGNITSSLNKIENLLLFTRVNKEFNFLNSELNLIKLFIQLNLSEQSIEYIDLSKYSDNKEFNSLLLKFYLAINYIKQGNPQNAKSLLEILSKKKNGIEFNYLNLLFAEIYMNEKLNDYNYLDIFLSRNKGKSYIKAALRKKAWKAILMDDVSQYQLFMRRIQTEGSENTDEDKQAMFEAKSNIIPNKYLLSSRLYFDGGQYELSLNQLNFIDVITLDLEEKSELYYRKGRCFQRLNKFEEAQNEFNNSIAISRLSNPYIFAVSCFNKAQIYEHLNSKSQDIKYYQMELDTKQHPYKISLDAKSKAALQRLNQP